VQVQDDLPYRKLYYFYNLVLTKSAQLQKTEKMGEKKTSIDSPERSWYQCFQLLGMPEWDFVPMGKKQHSFNHLTSINHLNINYSSEKQVSKLNW